MLVCFPTSLKGSKSSLITLHSVKKRHKGKVPNMMKVSTFTTQDLDFTQKLSGAEEVAT